MMDEFIFPLRVYTEDTDYGGVVYHANYLSYFERARSEWAESVGLTVEWYREQGVYFAVRYAKMDYLKPARLHQNLEVVSRIIELRPASIVYEQYLRLKDIKDTILCKAEIKIACVGIDFKPKILPEQINKLINGERA